MKRIGILLAACMLLTGCGSQLVSAEQLNSAPSTAPTAWGLQTDSQIGAASHSEQESAADPIPMPAPTPTPTYVPVSLAETLKSGPQVIADGITLSTLTLGDDTYVNADGLQTVYPWLTLSQGAEGMSITKADGSAVSMPFVETDGSAMLPETGDVGIHFVGGQEEYWLPLRYVAQQVGLYLLWDDSTATAYVTKMPDTDLIPQGRTVPVWMYHEVGDDVWGIESLFVSPDHMREQLQYLKDNGYQPIFFSDLTHLEDYDKPVILTFDDGYIGMYTELFPLLKEFNMKATVFVITGSLGTEHYISDEQMKEMSDSGLVSMQSHTVSHPALAELGAEEQEEELRQSQLDIARVTGKIPYALSYPTGSHNTTTVEIGKQYYAFGILMNGGKWTIDNNYFAISRLYAARTTDLDTYSSAMK